MRCKPPLAAFLAILTTDITASNTKRNLRGRCLLLLTGLSLMLNPRHAAAEPPQPQMAGGKPPYNIVFIIVDQRTFHLLAGSDYSLPGHSPSRRQVSKPLHCLGHVHAVTGDVPHRPTTAIPSRHRPDAVLVRPDSRPQDSECVFRIERPRI
jgi:hypothetical protein